MSAASPAHCVPIDAVAGAWNQRGPGHQRQPLDRQPVRRHDHCAVRARRRRAASKARMAAPSARAVVARAARRHQPAVSNAGLRADLSTKPRFNDIQLAARQRPRSATRQGALAPSALVEQALVRRPPLFDWSNGASSNCSRRSARATQLGLSGSEVHQDILRNPDQDGWRSAVNADLTHSRRAVRPASSFRYGALDARVAPRACARWAADCWWFRGQRRNPVRRGRLQPHARAGTVVPVRQDAPRRSLGLDRGRVLTKARLGGFSPLVRVTHSDSSANIALYDYRRTRLDLGAQPKLLGGFELSSSAMTGP